MTNSSRSDCCASRFVKDWTIRSDEQLFVLIGAVDRQTPAGEQDFDCAPQSEHYVRKFSRRFEHAVLHHGRGARELIGRGCERVLHFVHFFAGAFDFAAGDGCRVPEQMFDFGDLILGHLGDGRKMLRPLREIAPGLFQLGHHAMRHLQDGLGVVEKVFGAGLKLARPLDDRDHPSGQKEKSEENHSLDDYQQRDRAADDIKYSAIHYSLSIVSSGQWAVIATDYPLSTAHFKVNSPRPPRWPCPDRPFWLRGSLACRLRWLRRIGPFDD